MARKKEVEEVVDAALPTPEDAVVETPTETVEELPSEPAVETVEEVVEEKTEIQVIPLSAKNKCRQ